MSNIQKVIGQNIKIFRQTRGITQEGLAEMVNVSGSYIGYMERGKKSPSLDLLVKIAGVFKVEPAILLTSVEGAADQELKKLIALLSNKGAGPVKFLNEVATAYFRIHKVNKF
ncbi:MAG: helix-turn-helix transcriptional regulator [Bacillota bacterium]